MTGTAQSLDRQLAGQVNWADKLSSFSPHYSNVGLSFGGELGIVGAWLHYNRNTSPLGVPFLRIGLDGGWPKARSRHGVLGVTQTAGAGGVALECNVAFAGFDSWVTEITAVNRSHMPRRVVAVVTPFNERAKRHAIKVDTRRSQARIACEMPTSDRRDPDWYYSFALAMRWRRGDWDAVTAWSGEAQTASERSLPVNNLNPQPGIVLVRTVPPGVSVALSLGFSASLPGTTSALPGRLDFDAARKATAAWWQREFPMAGLAPAKGRAARVQARAVVTLAFNATRAPGRLRHGVSVFPNRGRYPVQYFWDSFFQNLGLLRLNPALARDSLALLLANMGADGKVPQFVASTWVRPGSSQCPLLGWGVRQYAEVTGDWDFARRALPALERNTRWWFKARDPDGSGLVGCWDPFEIWDDTPRLDGGAICPVDVNALLALQMDVCATLAERAGQKARAGGWRRRSAALKRQIVETLYCPRDNLFYDLRIQDGRRVKLKTPASFMPLLLEDLPLPEDRRRAMVRDWLLSPRHFFGRVQFPVVAYDEPCYQSDKWWRGPMWPSTAWFMLEVLKRTGFAREYRNAVARLLDVFVADGELHELFDSRTGQGLGAVEQGWTAGLCLACGELLRESGSEHQAP